MSLRIWTLSTALAIGGMCSQSAMGHDDEHEEPSSREVVTYYVGRDNLPTLTSGTYAGLPNPNFGRLSLLVGHEHAPLSESHFHAIGIYTYTGTPPGQTIRDTNANNQLPETSTSLPPIALVPGHGLFAGKLVNLPDGSNFYSDTTIRSTQTLADDADGSIGFYILHSGSNRYSQPLDGAQVALELVSMSPGLHVGDAHELDVVSLPGDRYLLGDGNTFEAAPTFWVDLPTSVPTDYSATFRLVDLSESFGTSGVFTLNFRAAVPEPGTLALFPVAVIGLYVCVWRWKGGVNDVASRAGTSHLAV